MLCLQGDENLEGEFRELQEHAAGSKLSDSLCAMPARVTRLKLKNADATPMLPLGERGLTRAAKERCRALTVLHIQACPEHMMVAVIDQPLTSLRKLTIDTVDDLIKLPDINAGDASLQTLHIQHCHNLQKLPRNISSMAALQELRLEHCDHLHELPASMRDMPALTRLVLNNCAQLQPWQDSARCPATTTLSCLTITACPSFDHLPESLAEATQLQCIHVTTAPKQYIFVPKLLREELGSCEIEEVRSLRFDGNFTLPHPGQGAQKLGELSKHVDDHQVNEDIRRALLGDKSARRDALGNLSIVGVLLATAAFAAFAAAPATPALFQTAREDDDVHDNFVSAWRIRRLRDFFICDQCCFAFSIAIVLLVLVSFVPTKDHADELTQAGRAWLKLAFLSILLVGAVVTGVLSFLFAGLAAYPEQYRGPEMWCPMALCFVLVGGAVVWLAVALYKLRPGVYAVQMALWAYTYPLRKLLKTDAGAQSEGVKPPPSTDESVASLVKLMRQSQRIALQAQADTQRLVQLAEQHERTDNAMRLLMGQQAEVLRDILAMLQAANVQGQEHE